MTSRQPEFPDEAEQSVLGALLLDPDCGDDVFEILKPEDFAREQHQVLFAAALHVNAVRKVDPVTVHDELSRRGHLERVGGIEYLALLNDSVPTSANVVYHAQLVRDRAMERRIVNGAKQILQLAGDAKVRGEEFAAQAERMIFEAAERSSLGKPQLAKDIIWRVIDLAEERHAKSVTLLGVGSGLSEVDELTAGWQNGDYILLCARPSQGKTAIALHFAMAAAKTGTPVLVISLEMGGDQLMNRMLAAEADVNARHLQRGRLRDSDWPRLSTASGLISSLPLVIDDAPTRSISSVRALCRRMKRAYGIGMVVIDYAQLIYGDEQEENRQQEMRMVSAGIKRLGRELGIPAIVCSQLSREPEKRGGESRPRLSDIRESGAFEQDADVVFMLWNDPSKVVEVGPAPLTLVLAKQRNGPTGDVDVHFDRASGRFSNWRTRD